MSDLDDLILRDYDDGSRNFDWHMNEAQNTQPEDPTMTKQELARLQADLRKFIDFVDLQDSKSIARARTHDFATLLATQHEKNKKVLNSALAHINAVRQSPT